MGTKRHRHETKAEAHRRIEAIKARHRAEPAIDLDDLLGSPLVPEPEIDLDDLFGTPLTEPSPSVTPARSADEQDGRGDVLRAGGPAISTAKTALIALPPSKVLFHTSKDVKAPPPIVTCLRRTTSPPRQKPR